MPNAQMNFRIDAEVKRRGDERFASLGCTPSHAMRRLYECAARYDEESERVLRTLIEPDDSSKDTLASQREKSIYEFQESLAGRYRSLGLVPGTCPHVMSDVALRDMLYDELEEKMTARGLL